MVQYTSRFIAWTTAVVLSTATVVLAGMTVTNTNDSGEGSLRWAIGQANINAGPDTIVFNIPDTDPGYDAGTGVWTISPIGSLPYVVDDGTVIDGSTQSGFIGTDINPFGPEIEIDGIHAGEFQIDSNNNVIRGLVLNRFPNSGLYIWGADSNRVVGCYIGTDATGTIAVGNGTRGITLGSSSSYNTIGDDGIDEWNLISANGSDGILIGADCSNNSVLYNRIGTDRTGIDPLGNEETGVFIGNGAIGDSARSNTIGPGNIIAWNGQYGVSVLGEAVDNNTITTNSITNNTFNGIIHSENGNNNLESPVITGAFGSEVIGTACPNCIVEIFSDPEDEGKIFEGTTTADGSGNFVFTGNVSGPFVTATATDASGNTSEFSAPFFFSPNIIVTTTNDTGDGSLRWAIGQANINAGPDTIVFNIPDTDPGYDAGTGVWTIQPLTIFPSLSDDGTIIDGTSQAAFIGSDTNPNGPEIEIDGTNTTEWQTLLKVRSSSNVIKGLVINRYNGYVIWLHENAHYNTIHGNYLGTDASGTVDLGNYWPPILINNGADYNVIGGPYPEERNLISGNDDYGIRISGTGTEHNSVSGNYIGTDVSGTSALGNSRGGVKIHAGAQNNHIGVHNVIAFNQGDGIYVTDDTTTGNNISRNSITSNSGLGINNESGGNIELAPPIIDSVSLNIVSGTACPNCRVEIFSDRENEGGKFEGTVTADASGNFAFNVITSGPYVTATATDIDGNTSEFSVPYPYIFSIVVTNTNDSGVGSLRWAIDLANAHVGPDTISFNIPDTDPGYDSETGVWTIQPMSALTELYDDGTVIDGTTQSAFIGSDTNPYGPEIEIDGSNVYDETGIYLSSADNLIRGLVINRFSGDSGGVGIVLSGNDVTGNVIVGCYIGTDVTGMVAMGNSRGGIIISQGANGNHIGGPTAADRNLICGTTNKGNILTGNGVAIGHIGDPPGAEENNNIVIGNYIGVNREGTAALPNYRYGISIFKGSGNIIGGTNPGEGNTITGNGACGVVISHTESSNNIVAGNFIGTNASGASNIGNSYCGIALTGRANHNTIGPNNVIAYNVADGVYVEMDFTINNTITRNSITNNGGLGINNDSGGNIELAPPVIISVTESVVSGTACPNCIVEVFSDTDDEGEIFEVSTTADGSGNFTLAAPVTGPYVTATATDGDGNTSEFSVPYSLSECTLGDVNCDDNITPGDALCTFWRSILGSFVGECLCECSEQASEINCDGSITPGDALCIFWRSILGDWTEECHCPTAKVVAQSPLVDKVTALSLQGTPGEKVKVTITVENPDKLDAFAMKLSYPSSLLVFDRVFATSSTEEWIALDGRMTGEGSVTIGGFNTEGISSDGPVAIAEVVFTVQENVSGHGEFDLTNLADDLAGAQVSKGSFVVREIPTTYGLSQNYPNPFNTDTDIRYQIPDSRYPSHTTLKIYNILGQEVRTLVDQVQEAGYYTVTWDGQDKLGQDVPSGVYFYRLTAKNFTATRRMVLMK